MNMKVFYGLYLFSSSSLQAGLRYWCFMASCRLAHFTMRPTNSSKNNRITPTRQQGYLECLRKLQQHARETAAAVVSSTISRAVSPCQIQRKLSLTCAIFNTPFQHVANQLSRSCQACLLARFVTGGADENSFLQVLGSPENKRAQLIARIARALFPDALRFDLRVDFVSSACRR
jgi:hypothetical protein